jgi:hypothetical protein
MGNWLLSLGKKVRNVSPLELDSYLREKVKNLKDQYL